MRTCTTPGGGDGAAGPRVEPPGGPERAEATLVAKRDRMSDEGEGRGLSAAGGERDNPARHADAMRLLSMLSRIRSAAKTPARTHLRRPSTGETAQFAAAKLAAEWRTGFERRQTVR